MANTCCYTMRAKGTTEAIDELVARLTSYDHTPHFWRVYNTEVTELGEKDGKRLVEIYGDCAWSVAACMTYKPASYANEFGGEASTSLKQTSADCGLDIEVFASEPSLEFAEHYLYRADGSKEVDEETECHEVGWDRYEYPTFEALLEDYPEYAEMGVTEETFGDEEWVIVGGYGEDWDETLAD